MIRVSLIDRQEPPTELPGSSDCNDQEELKRINQERVAAEVLNSQVEETWLVERRRLKRR
jgi:hypothetical protein